MQINAASTMAALRAQLAEAASGVSTGAQKGISGTRSAGGGDFVSSLDSALKAVSASQAQATETQRQFQMENPAVSLEETMISMNKAQISFSAAVQVRNRLVQAYEQMMNMPV